MKRTSWSLGLVPAVLGLVLAGFTQPSARAADSAPPTGTIVINNNRSATNTPNVTLALTWDDGVGGSGVAQMRFSDDGAHWTAWQPPQAMIAHALPPGDGHKTVRVQYLDKANNRSAVYSDYILLDTTPPTGSIIINHGDATTTSRSVTLGLTWSDGSGSGVTRMRFSDDGAHWTAWSLSQATCAHTLTGLTGYNTVRVQYLDGAGNYSAVYSDYIKLLPSTIGTVEDLQKIGNDPAYPLNGSYVLTHDIDASATATWKFGAGFVPIGTFTGTFDGQGHVISGLTINSSGNAGLFAGVGSGGQVKNVGLLGGAVSGSGANVGGLVGGNSGTVTNCHATGMTVTGTGTGSESVGGLVGYNYPGTVTQCYATGPVTVTGPDSSSFVGGLVGQSLVGTVTQCYATGAVSAGYAAAVGGLVGRMAGGMVEQSHATGTVTSGEVGGLVGFNNNGTVTQCYATGTVTVTSSGTTDHSVCGGGLVGANGGSTGLVVNCHATGEVTGANLVTDIEIGGLVGANNSGGAVTQCYATGPVSGAGPGGQYTLIGGLVGTSSGSVTQCYAAGPVTGGAFAGLGAGNGAYTYVGGLIGFSDKYGVETASYATGAVSGSGSGQYNYIGGLAGATSGSVTQCYATGLVTRSVSGQYSIVGGLVATNGGTVDSSYWDVNTSGQTTSRGGTGEATAAMMTQTTFAGWDFINVWAISEGQGYPYLLALSTGNITGM